MSLSPLQLEQYLHEHIPLSQAMQVSVAAATADEVVLNAPLEPNINHRGTAFGGSASALAILAAWSLLYVRLGAEKIPCRLVIHRNTMEYNRPVTGPLAARASLEEAADWPRFTGVLRRRGRARIRVAAVLSCGGEPAGKFVGEFVALRPAAGDGRRP